MVHGISTRPSNSALGDFNFSFRMNQLKQNLTLDLHIDSSKCKKIKFNSNHHEAPLLSTPDMQSFILNTPEVEKMLSENPSSDLLTATPNTMRTLFCKNEPETFNDDGLPSVLSSMNNESSHGIVLNGLQKCNIENNNSNLSINDYDYENQYPTPITSSYSMDVSSLPTKIKDEPQIVPNMVVSPPVSPINMFSQEQLKADRKKARNRLAAAKCRKKKLERISCLETRVKELKDENNELGQKQATLKKEVSSLKERIVRHYQSGCSIMPMSVPLF